MANPVATANADIHIVVVDYGMGNLRSVQNAIAHTGDYQVRVSSTADDIRAADVLIIPGVGAFGDAMKNLRQRDLIPVLNEVRNRQVPVLGICLGMQLFFDSSAEGGRHAGLGWIPGTVEYIEVDAQYRVPHVGWNDLNLTRPSPMFSQLQGDRNFYFVHSYHAVCDPAVLLATVDYGMPITAAVQHGHIVGMQFHPEKSQRNGMLVLKSYLNWAAGLVHA
jgi:imidazole glycerol-phosphate synthase subunit HisH